MGSLLKIVAGRYELAPTKQVVDGEGRGGVVARMSGGASNNLRSSDGCLGGVLIPLGEGGGASLKRPA